MPQADVFHMILLCGIPSEPPLALAIQAARDAGIPYVVLNQRDSRYFDAALRLDGVQATGSVWIQEKEWRLEDFSGVYTRMMDPQFLPENTPCGRRPPDALALRKSVSLAESLDDWMEIARCRVVNRTSTTLSNASKPYQAQRIRAAGFRIPTTLVTNRAEEVLQFFHQHRRIIFKSISSVRSIVREFHLGMLKDMQKLAALPVQFQAYVPGVNIRVHVIAQTVIATKIDSEAVDYRYSAQDGLEVTMEPFTLPQPIRDKCEALARHLNLVFCGIDLKRTPQGEYYCFEVNPAPAYSYFEQLSGQPIAKTLVEYLGGPVSRNREKAIHASASD